MIQAKMTSKGQITIPKVIRTRLNVHDGDHITFIFDRKGRIILTAQTIDVSELFGIVKVKKRFSLTNIHEAIGKEATRRYLSVGH